MLRYGWPQAIIPMTSLVTSPTTSSGASPDVTSAPCRQQRQTNARNSSRWNQGQQTFSILLVPFIVTVLLRYFLYQVLLKISIVQPQVVHAVGSASSAHYLWSKAHYVSVYDQHSWGYLLLPMVLYKSYRPAISQTKPKPDAWTASTHRMFQRYFAPHFC